MGVIRRLTSLIPWKRDDAPADALDVAVVRERAHEALDTYFDHMVDDWFGWPWERFLDEARSPVAHVEEDDTGFTVRLDVPGYAAEHLEVSLANDGLLVRGRVEHEGESGRDGRSRTERRLMLRVPLGGEGVSAGAGAEVRNGVLTVRVPKSEEARRRSHRIPVAAA